MIPLLLFVLGAALTPPTLALLARRLPKSTNYRGRPIPTSAGLTLMPIILLTLVLTLWGVAPTGSGGVAFLAYSALVCLVGFADDLWGGVGDRGFAGHLGALLRGRLTTGLVKVAVFGGGALAVAAVIYGVGWRAVVGGALLAGSVNLANLFDVRPGRAIKFVGLAILGLAFAAPAWAVVSAAGVAGGFVGLFYFDVRGRIMVGDAGAAILGAVMGFLILAAGPGTLWALAGMAILGLTAVAEFSSISRLVEEVRLLRRLDLWGRGSGE